MPQTRSIQFHIFLFYIYAMYIINGIKKRERKKMVFGAFLEQ